MLVGDTLAEAWVRGATFAGLGHLLFAMLRKPDCDGARYLASTGARRARLRAFVTGAGGLDQTAMPYPDGVMADLEAKAHRRGVGAWFARLMVGLSTVDAAMGWASADAKAQAVRLDHGVAGAGHALLGMLRTDECILAKGVLMPPPVRARNRGADLLRGVGLNPYRLAAKLSTSAPLPDPGPEAIAAQVTWLRRGDPFLADELLRAEERAEEISREHGHTGTGTTHYLLALLDAPTAGPLLAACRVEAGDLRARAVAAVRAIPSAQP